MNISVNEKFKILSIDDLQKRALRCLKFMEILMLQQVMLG